MFYNCTLLGNVAEIKEHMNYTWMNSNELSNYNEHSTSESEMKMFVLQYGTRLRWQFLKKKSTREQYYYIYIYVYISCVQSRLLFLLVQPELSQTLP